MRESMLLRGMVHTAESPEREEHRQGFLFTNTRFLAVTKAVLHGSFPWLFSTCLVRELYFPFKNWKKLVLALHTAIYMFA